MLSFIQAAIRVPVSILVLLELPRQSRLILPETPPEVMLLLENDVGAGNSLGDSFEQIGMVLNVLPQYEGRLGVCLDTAHLWGAGHDISNAEFSAAATPAF